MSRSIEDARRVLDAQPFSRLVRAEMTQYTTQVVELRVPITEQIQQQHGFVHGGVVSYLADNALTFAGGMALGPGVVTSEYKINYVRPAVGDWLVVRARRCMQAVHRLSAVAMSMCSLAALKSCALSHRERLP